MSEASIMSRRLGSDLIDISLQSKLQLYNLKLAKINYILRLANLFLDVVDGLLNGHEAYKEVWM